MFFSSTSARRESSYVRVLSRQAATTMSRLPRAAPHSILIHHGDHGGHGEGTDSPSIAPHDSNPVEAPSSFHLAFSLLSPYDCLSKSCFCAKISGSTERKILKSGEFVSRKDAKSAKGKSLTVLSSWRSLRLGASRFWLRLKAGPGLSLLSRHLSLLSPCLTPMPQG